MIHLNRQQIEENLPHRGRWCLLDSAETTYYQDDSAEDSPDLMSEGAIRAFWSVKTDSWSVDGHFPETPLVPGMLMVEAIAQASALLARAHSPRVRGGTVLLVGVSNARFHRPVTVPATIELRSQVTRVRSDVWKFLGQALVDGIKVTEAELLGRVAPKGILG